MQVIHVSATVARNNFFKLLEQVKAGKSVVVQKDQEEIAVISPKVKKTDIAGLRKALKAAAGTLKDYNPKDNPLRKPRAVDFLGRWDKSDYKI